jgi:hypothetical protein
MRRKVGLETVRELMLALPGVTEGTSFGTVAFRVGKKFLARMKEDGVSLVLKCADRDPLLESDPDAFYVTKHYENYPAVLVRLAKVHRARLARVIEEAWRMEASPRLIRLHESGAYQPLPREDLPRPFQPKRKRSRVDQLARVRRICMALPEAVEKEAWGAPTFRVKNKMFAMYFNNHHGDGRVALWLNAPPGIQTMLVQSEPERFFIPPYQGVYGWIGVYLDRNSDAEVAFHVRQAYCMVAPSKLQALLGPATPASAGR